MPIYEIEKDGRTFEVDAPNQTLALTALIHVKPEQRTEAGLPTGAASGAIAAAAPAVERAGLEIATNPKVGTAIKAASKPAAQMIARAVGATGGVAGYIASEALTHPATTAAVETGVRAGGRGLATVAGAAGKYAGPIAMLADLATTPPRVTDAEAARIQRMLQQDQVNALHKQLGDKQRTGDIELTPTATVAREEVLRAKRKR